MTSSDAPIQRVYTRGGDKGETSLVGGQRVGKDDVRLEAYGAVDELNAVVGMVRAEIAACDADGLDGMDAQLARAQHALFNLGSLLATLPADQTPSMPRVGDADIAGLEQAMDGASAMLSHLRSFVLPGGSRLNAVLHLARTVCRRAERRTVALQRDGGCGEEEVRYLNRLSDAFFVWSRQAAAVLGHDEVLWSPKDAQ